MKFLFSSIGKKIQIALSGIFLCIFLIFHLLNNITLFFVPDIFNSLVYSLELIKPIIRIMEFGLLCILILHIGNAIKITLENKKANPTSYQISQSNEISNVNSRYMIISGSIILFFLIFHLGYIWYNYQILTSIILQTNETYYDILLRNQFGFLGHRLTRFIYIISIIFIMQHLHHGFQSALKTFGIIKQSKLSFLYNLAIVFWAIIPVGFILIILAIEVRIIN